MAAPDWTAAQEEAMRTASRHELAYRFFRDFARQFWPVAVPSDRCVWGRHMTVICDEIQAVIEESDRRRARADAILAAHPPDIAAALIEDELGGLPRLRLVLLVPPRYSKSTLLERLLPAWRWGHRPQEKILALSANEDLIERDGLALRDVVRSPEYQAWLRYIVEKKRLPRVFTLRDDQHAKKNFDTSEGGKRAGYSLGSRYTGADSDLTAIDDPHDVDDAMGGTPAQQMARMEETENTYRDKVQDRLISQIFGMIFLIMQRVHIRDLSAYMIKQGARVVCLPAAYMPDHPFAYEKDWRTEPGEPLNPLRFPRQVLEAKRAESPHGFATKEMMLPTVQEGTRYRRDWFKQHYDEDPHDLAYAMDEVTISVDAAAKAGPRNDYASIGVWGRKGAMRYLFARVYRKMEFPALRAAFEQVCREWPMAALKLVEDKSNGTALISACRSTIPGIVPCNPRGDKGARSTYAEAVFGAGQVWLPKAPWVEEYTENMVGFLAGGLHDDDVDMTSQVMERWAAAVAPWLGSEQRALISEARPGVQYTEHAWRWARREVGEDYWMGIVPGWGKPGDEAIAVTVDRKGRMVSLVEVSDGGHDAFVSAVGLESDHWAPKEARYAEAKGGPAVQVVVALARQRVRIAAWPGKSRQPGQPGAGWDGKAADTAALWTSFLAMLGEGLVGVRDARTLSHLETVVEEQGQPRMPDGTPIGGRVLALLLALSARHTAVMREAPAERERFRFMADEKGDSWAVGGKRAG